MTESPQATRAHARLMAGQLENVLDRLDLSSGEGVGRLINWAEKARDHILFLLSTPAPRPQEGEAVELRRAILGIEEITAFVNEMEVLLTGRTRAQAEALAIRWFRKGFDQAAARLDALEGEVRGLNALGHMNYQDAIQRAETAEQRAERAEKLWRRALKWGFNGSEGYHALNCVMAHEVRETLATTPRQPEGQNNGN